MNATPMNSYGAVRTVPTGSSSFYPLPSRRGRISRAGGGSGGYEAPGNDAAHDQGELGFHPVAAVALGPVQSRVGGAN